MQNQTNTKVVGTLFNSLPSLLNGEVAVVLLRANIWGNFQHTLGHTLLNFRARDLVIHLRSETHDDQLPRLFPLMGRTKKGRESTKVRGGELKVPKALMPIALYLQVAVGCLGFVGRKRHSHRCPTRYNRGYIPHYRLAPQGMA